MAKSFSEIEADFLALQSRIGDLLDAAPEDQKQRLKDQYEIAQKTYFDALNKGFQDGDKQVELLIGQLKAANETLKNSVAELGGIAKAIDAVTSAVSIVVKLAALAA